MIKLMKLENKSVRMGGRYQILPDKIQNKGKNNWEKNRQDRLKKKHGNRYKALFCFVGLENLKKKKIFPEED